MAPRLIARPISLSQPGGKRPAPAREPEADRDLTRQPNNRSNIQVGTDRCHSSRVKGAIAHTDRKVMCGREAAGDAVSWDSEPRRTDESRRSSWPRGQGAGEDRSERTRV